MSDKEDSGTPRGRTKPSEPTEAEAAAAEPATADAHDDGWIDIASVDQAVHQPEPGGTIDAGGDDQGSYFVADSFSFGVEREMVEVDPDLVADGLVGPETDAAPHIRIEMDELLVTSVTTGGSGGEELDTSGFETEMIAMDLTGDAPTEPTEVATPDPAQHAEYELEPAIVANYGIGGSSLGEQPQSDADQPTSGATVTTSDPADDPTAGDTVSINFARVEVDYLAETEMVDLDTSGRLETTSLADASEPLPTEGIGAGGLDELLDG